MAGGKMVCSKCGKNITIEGSQICPICDPDMNAIIEGTAPTNTPLLCGECFQSHTAEHTSQSEGGMTNTTTLSVEEGRKLNI